MTESHRLLMASICRAIANCVPVKARDAKKVIDVHALDDWSPDFFTAKNAVTTQIANTYTELWRRFEQGHKDGTPDIANAARAKALLLIEALRNFTHQLQEDFPEGEPVIENAARDFSNK